MGTRADFYVGRGEQAEWLGSIAWDGYPDGIDDDVLAAKDEAAYRRVVVDFLKREDGTLPEMGWPWPWEDSRTTDYAYAYDGEQVWASDGRGWWDATKPEPEEDMPPTAVFPNMKDRQNVTLGPRSGLIVVKTPKTS